MTKDPVNKIGKKMDKAKAKKWVKDYKEIKDFESKDGWLYGREILETLCNYPDSEGIWFFKGVNDEKEECLVLFPADADGNILDKKIKSLGAAAAGDGDEDDAADSGLPCPANCPTNFT